MPARRLFVFACVCWWGSILRYRRRNRFRFPFRALPRRPGGLLPESGFAESAPQDADTSKPRPTTSARKQFVCMTPKPSTSSLSTVPSRSVKVSRRMTDKQVIPRQKSDRWRRERGSDLAVTAPERPRRWPGSPCGCPAVASARCRSPWPDRGRLDDESPW